MRKAEALVLQADALSTDAGNQLQTLQIQYQNVIGQTIQEISLFKQISTAISQMSATCNSPVIPERLRELAATVQNIAQIGDVMQQLIQRIISLKQQLKQKFYQQDVDAIERHVQLLETQQKRQLAGMPAMQLPSLNQFHAQLQTPEGKRQFVREMMVF